MTEPPTLGRRFRSIALPLIVLRGFGQVAEFGGFVVLARRLGADSFGRLAVAFLICRYAGLLGDWGATVRGVRDVAADRGPAALRALARRRTLVTALLSALYLVGTLVADSADLAPLVTVILALGLSRDWLSLGHERAVRSALPAAIQGTTILVAALLLADTTRPAIPVAIGYGAAVVVSLLVNRLPATSATSAPARRPTIDAWLLLAIVANQVLSSVDTLLLAAFRGTRDAGVYAAVYRLPNAWLALLVILTSGLLPLATRTFREGRDPFLALRAVVLRWGRRGALLLVLAAPVAYLLIPVVFGHAYDDGRAPVVILLLATAVSTAAAPLHQLYLTGGSDRSYGLMLFATAALNVAVNVVTIPLFGLIGAAVATLLANVLLATLVARGVSDVVRDLSDRDAPGHSSRSDRSLEHPRPGSGS